jgi:hypothetical protein
VRASGSQAYDVLVRFFPCRVYIDSSRHDTLDYEWSLSVAVTSYYVPCTVDGFNEMDVDMIMIVLSL